MSKICQSCHHKNLDIAIYCAKCGNKLKVKTTDKNKTSSTSSEKEKDIDTKLIRQIQIGIFSVIAFIVILFIIFNYLSKVKNQSDYAIREDIKSVQIEELLVEEKTMKETNLIIDESKSNIQLLENSEGRINNIFSLKININPSNARVKILNIKSKYYNGIKLKKGNYHVEISKKGYISNDGWVEIKEDTSLNITLDKIEIIKVIDNFSLKINTIPSNTQIKILNIKPKYYDGIKLKKGKYHIEVSKNGYRTIDKWITLKQNENFNFELQKIKKYIAPKVIKDEHVMFHDSYVSSKVIKYEDSINNYTIPKQMTQKERENLNTCMNGSYASLCKHSWLTSEQAIKVKQAERRENLNTCMNGSYASLCKHSWLTSEQAIKVKQAERRENLNTCMNGSYASLCKHSWLTSEQAIKVKQAERRENLNTCMNGSYASLCKHSWLTSQQANEVRIAENREGN